MSGKENRICVCCGKSYEYCNTCAAHKHLAPWHTVYCSENCRTIFSTVTDYKAHVITKEQAYEKLNKGNTNADGVKSSIKKTVDEIIFVENKSIINENIKSIAKQDVANATQNENTPKMVYRKKKRNVN